MDVYKTVSIYDSKIAIVTGNQNIKINNITSLEGKEVLTVKNTKIAQYLKVNKAKVKEYKNIKELVSNMKASSIAAMDEKIWLLLLLWKF